MAYLFYGFDSEWKSKIIDIVISNLPDSPIISYSTINHHLSKREAEIKQFVDDYTKLVANDFSFMNLEEYYPLDSNIIEKMSSTERLCLSSLDRYEFFKNGNDYHKRRKQYLEVLRYVNNLFLHEKISLVVMANIPHLLCGMVIYGYCKAFNIPIVIWYSGTIIPGNTTTGYFLSDIFNPFPLLNQDDNDSYNGKSSKLADLYIEKYGPKNEQIKSLVTLDEYIKKPGLIAEVKKKADYWRNRVKASDFSVLERYRHHRRLRRNSRYLYRNSCIPSLSEKYFYFPLHYQPECTSMPMGGVYSDQLLVCEMISYLLPSDVYLYVKPHPNPSKIATVDFYKRIKRLRNTVLVSDSCNTYDLIDNSISVVTLTGTVALESLVREKPVLMFGFYYYQYAPGVFHIKTLEDCKKAIDSVVKGKVLYSIEDFKRFIWKYEKLSINGFLDESYAEISPVSLEDCIKNVSKGLISYIKENNLVNAEV